MTVNCSPFGPLPQFELSSGQPAVGNQLFFYVAGSVNTKQNTYTDSTGGVANANPLVLNSLGQPTTQIWFTAGQSYKVVFAPAGDTDPPSSPIWTIDNLKGINDTTVTASEWVAGPAPTYVSATSFTLAGDQRSTFTVGRRLQFTVTAGTVYGRIMASAYAVVTTVTVQMDGSQALDSGLSAVNYSLLASLIRSLPERIAAAAGTDTYTATVGMARYVIGDEYKVRVTNANTSTTPTLSFDGLSALTIVKNGNAPLAAGDMAAGGEYTFRYTSAGNLQLLNPTVVVPSQTILRNSLSGFVMSTAGGSATMSIGAGQASDSTNAQYLTLSAISKTTSAWAVGSGNGGLDSGIIANSTWYAFYAITRTDTGVVDVIFSVNGTTPSLPASYTLYRRIGWGLTSGSAQWVQFTQYNDRFMWTSPQNDVNAGTMATANRTTRTLSAAPSSEAIFGVDVTGSTSAGCYVLFTTSDQSDVAASATFFTTVFADAAGSGTAQHSGAADLQFKVNSSRQLFERANSANGISYMTRGWVDYRGRDA